jgi:uncharacterized protein involved in exopolysaccharide biosynthesis
VVIRPPKDSYVIVVSMYLPVREGAARVLNSLLDIYLQRRAALFEERTAVPVFRSEAAARSAGLSEAETQLQAFETQSGISAIEKQKEVLLSEIARSDEELRSAELARGEAAEKLSRMERELQSSEPDFAALGDFEKDSFVGSLLLQLSELQKEREQLRLTELDSGARIQNNRSQFSALMKLVLSNLRSTLEQFEATRESRAVAVKQLHASLANLHDQQSRWTDLRRKTEVLESDYLFYGKKLAEASANAALAKADTSNVVIAERAMDAIAPSGMRKTTLLEISLGVALLAALSWVAVLEFFDHGLYSGADLEKRLGAPVLASVPFAKPGKMLETSRTRWYHRAHAMEN